MKDFFGFDLHIPTSDALMINELKKMVEFSCFTWQMLTLNAPIAIKGVCFSRLLKCLRGLYGKQCEP